jgi:hypothetical protein
VEGVRTHRCNRALARQGAAGLRKGRAERLLGWGFLLSALRAFMASGRLIGKLGIALCFQLKARSLPPDFTTLPLAITCTTLGHDKVEQDAGNV